jgi:serine/threonine-protein kinase RsbT
VTGAVQDPLCRYRVSTDTDVVGARLLGRETAEKIGFGRLEQALIATAVSELSRNIIAYAGSGEVVMMEVRQSGLRGMKVIASDEGPGIADIDEALTDGFSTGDSLGLGLPGTRRIVDELEIRSAPGEGCTVTAVKWLR